ncbi:MAG TPA: hypothetical protein VIL26_04350 [Clostridia bacterium]
MNDITLSKFKSTEELLKAYNNLHSAYTKKCQEYAALKKQLENEKQDFQQKTLETQNQDQIVQNDQVADNPLSPGQDNGSEPVKQEEQANDQTELVIDRFFEQYPQAKEYALEIGQALNTMKPEFNDLLAAFNAVLISKVQHPADILKDEKFLNDFVYQNEEIRQHFINDYLSKLVSVNVPRTICGQSTVISVLPPIRPKNLKDAQSLAKELLSKKGEF